MNHRNLFPLLFVLALAQAACGNKVPAAGHDHPAPAAGHGHDHGEAGEKRTHFTDRTELFVEFPPLVKGEPTAFAAHLTSLSDFRPVAAGRVTVALTGGGQPEEVFDVEAPTQPGIFRPEATPRHAGPRELAIRVATPGFTVEHRLGPVTVHPDRQSAQAVPAEAEAEGIGFTKEQQWKVDFATSEVRRRLMRTTVSATGTLRARPDGEAQLTAPVAGQVQAAGPFPYVGQQVRKGQLLAYLAPRLGGETDYAALEAAAHKARVAHEQASRERKRLEALYRDEAVPERRVQAARADEATAGVEREAAQRRLAQYAGGRGGIPLRAPVSGAIADVRVAPGTFVPEGQLLFHLADARVMWLEARLPEDQAARVAAPTGALFRVEGVDRVFEIVPGRNGRFVAAGGVVDPVTRTVPVIFEFERPDPALKIGMAARTQVYAGGEREALAVPAEAVLDESGVGVVFVEKGGESFERRPVRVGVREGAWVEVIEGLRPGERVVSRGAYLVKLAATATGAIGHGHSH